MVQLPFTDAFESFTAIELAAGALATGSAVVGLFIAYQAFRGLRRNDSKPMRYLSIGMMLVFGLTYAVAIAGQTLISVRALPLFFQGLFRFIVRLLQFTGLVMIAYSLRLATKTASPDATRPSGGGRPPSTDRTPSSSDHEDRSSADEKKRRSSTDSTNADSDPS